MTMATSTVVFLILAVAALCAAVFGSRLPRRFRDRTCQGRGWRRTFPWASKHEIREFLILFVQAFALSKKRKLQFDPNDSILEIYRGRNPSKWMPDALELETLAREVEAKYGLKVEAIWHENLTLGELFAHVRAART